APVYAVRLRQPDEIRVWSGVTTVTLDAATGRALHVYDAASAPLSNRLADAAFSVHSAEIAGLFGRLLLMLAGLSLPALYVTGLWAWWRRRRPRRRVVATSGACATSSA
ncbi:MAG: PepSY domain-containing protein, partial [Pseudomonadota bacterium]|nr:PepSY domain-containing protein [Pseudomonadota bacterium]